MPPERRQGGSASDESPRPVPGTSAARADGGEPPREGLWRVPTLALAIRNLQRNRLRSVLAALGIAIGVFVVVVLGVFGTVLQLSASEELGGIGNQVIVSPATETGEETLSARQLADVDRAAAGRGTNVPLYTDSGIASAGGDSAAVQLYGVDEPAQLFNAREGESLPVQLRGGVLVGSDVAESLNLGLGNAVEVNGQQYRVVGVMASGEEITPIQPDNAVVFPETEFTGEFDQSVVVADSPGDATAAAAEIRDTLNVRVEQVDVFELSEILETIDEFFTLLNRFLIALGAVSVIVAGVSILNLMLMSTSERRGEIGVMRAVGVHRREVLWLLLAEAALLGAVGGLVGALLSGTAALLLWAATPVTLDVVLVWRNAGYLVGGLLFGAAVALVSGAYPAWKAANERPVEALRG